MDYKKTFVEGDNRFSKYINSMNELAKTEHKNLAKIHMTELREGIYFIILRNSHVHQGQKNTHLL